MFYLRIIRLWYERPQLFNPVVDVVSSSPFDLKEKERKMIRGIVSRSAKGQSHNSLFQMINCERVGKNAAGDTYSNYGCLFSASLWRSLSCRVLQRKKKGTGGGGGGGE